MEKRRPRTADEVLAEHLEDPAFREQWERYAPARALANALVRYRADHDLSQTRLARILGVTQPMVAKWEIGEHNPAWETLLLVAGKLGISFLLETAPAERQPVWVPGEIPVGATIEKITSAVTGTQAYVVTTMPGPPTRESALV